MATKPTPADSPRTDGVSPPEELSPKAARLLSIFPMVERIVVRWGDMDALGHVNNTIYHQYFESTRIAYLERLGFGPPTLDAPRNGLVIAANSCRFRSPVSYPDTLLVGARVSALAEDRFAMEYAAVSTATGHVAAEGEAVVVSYDFTTGNAVPLRADVHAAIVALEGHEPPRMSRRDSIRPIDETAR